MSNNSPGKKKANQSPPVSLYHDLSGIDVQSTLERLSMNEDQLKPILNTFEKAYSTIIGEIEKALNDNNMEEARKLLHKLRGAAEAIGAGGVRGAAWELREKIISGTKNLNPFLKKLKGELEKVLKSIRSLDTSSTSTEKKNGQQ
jgi:HPt (histidine-containing phosphotransfer) domain-containing protein